MHAHFTSSPVAPLHAPSPQEAQPGEGEFAWRVLEEIDYGLIVVNAEGEMLHANHLARHELARERYLRIRDGRVIGRTPLQTEDIARGVERAAQGRRQMVMMRNGDQSQHVACVPLFHAFDGRPGSVLLMLSRQASTNSLALAFFSRTHGLTPAEEAVVLALCEGLRVPEIATRKGVSANTVRTHVRSVRDKTGTSSIRGLVQLIAALPPVAPLALSMGPQARES